MKKYSSLQIDEFPCKMVSVPNAPTGTMACRMELKHIDPQNLPTVSILTPTCNRDIFIPLMIRNWEMIDYPRNKLEWIIVDDGDNSIQHLLPPTPQIKYIHLKKKITIGKKRNFLATVAKHEYMVHMDDDDFYPPESVIARVKAIILSNSKNCTGCIKTLCYDMIHDQTFEAYDASVDDLPATISESTLAYKRSFWIKQKYNNQDKQAECLSFINGRHNEIIHIPYIFVVTQLSHNSNTIKRRTLQNTKHTAQFTDHLSMRDNMLIQNLRAKIISTIPQWDKAIKLVQKWTNLNIPFSKINNHIGKLPQGMAYNPLIINFIQKYKTKSKSTGKDVVFYCGPGKYLKHTDPWDGNSTNIGGSEEAVIHLSERLVQLGWNVTVYCLTEDFEDINHNGVIYKDYYNWLPLNKQDITIIWRDPSIIDSTINSNKIILDLHDVVDPNWITPQILQKITYIFVKSEYHKKILQIPLQLVKIIPNGIHSKHFINNLKPQQRKNIIINTSSPDRSVYALLRALPIIRKTIPDAEIHWAYGFASSLNKGGFEADKRDFISNWVDQTKKLMEQTEGFHNLGRLTQQNVISLYKIGKVFAYGTRFPEIDCISFTKAIAAGCIPAVTYTAALKDKMIQLYPPTPQSKFKFVKANLNNLTTGSKQIDYSIEDGDEFNEWVQSIIDALQNDHIQTQKYVDFTKSTYEWDSIVDRWIQFFNN